MQDLDAMDSMEKMLIQKAYQRQAPINGSLELLPLCNMNCDMCYVRLSKAEMEQKGRLRTKEEWIKLAHQMKDAGTLFLLSQEESRYYFRDLRKYISNCRRWE